MTNLQKTIYKALYEKNKDMLVKGLATNNPCNTNLNNLEIQLRKCCNHPFLIKELEEDLLKACPTPSERMEKLLTASGKMVLVKKLLEKCRNEGKKVLIFSQFTHMLQLI
jgi:chromodomain-helicase-DNA-binding protein 7